MRASIADVLAGRARGVVLPGDCRDGFWEVPDQSIDAVVTDPPYPEVNRHYGKLSVEDWWALMLSVVHETRRVLKPTGSAVFVLQPNSESLGTLRPWLFDFISYCCKEWNVLQDVWWWNPSAATTGGTAAGFLTPAVKACIWCGPPDAYKNQRAVLQPPSEQMVTRMRTPQRAARHNLPSGNSYSLLNASITVAARGGTAPMNLLRFANSNSTDSSAADGHGAGTPLDLAVWWMKYISPVGGVVLDPFMGAGTMARAALMLRRRVLGFEVLPEFADKAQRHCDGTHK